MGEPLLKETLSFISLRIYLSYDCSRKDLVVASRLSMARTPVSTDRIYMLRLRFDYSEEF